MIANLRYLNYLLRHKFYVLIAGRALGLGWRALLVHDLSKFSRAEWGPYVDVFFRHDQSEAAKERFAVAVSHHYTKNPHHWQHWIKGDCYAERMPERYVLEMVADWMAVSKEKIGTWDVRAYFLDVSRSMIMHPDTADLVDVLTRRTENVHRVGDLHHVHDL